MITYFDILYHSHRIDFDRVDWIGVAVLHGLRHRHRHHDTVDHRCDRVHFGCTIDIADLCHRVGHSCVGCCHDCHHPFAIVGETVAVDADNDDAVVAAGGVNAVAVVAVVDQFRAMNYRSRLCVA